MNIDDLITGFVYLFASIIVFYLGKVIYFWRYRSLNVGEELVIKDNTAFGIVISGYYLSLAIIVGGVVLGPSHGLSNDLFDIFFYGIIGIILLPISTLISDKIVFRHFDNMKEIIADKNVGLGFAEAAMYIAGAMVLFGALYGEGGNAITAIIFWVIGQIALILVTFIYDFITPYSLHETLEKDNVAVGIAYSGFLIAVGNMLRVSLQSDFTGWLDQLELFAIYLLIIIIVLPVVRILTDKLLLPGQKMADEIEKQNNLAAGTIAAVSYIITSLFISWSF